MDSLMVKQKAKELGASVCGIGSIERFAQAPDGTHPSDVLPSCRSVVVFGIRFNATLMNAKSTSPYTLARNTVMRELDDIACRLALEVADGGYDAVPVGATSPTEYDNETERTMGIISLKHSAVLCGLGKMGKNTLLVNEKFGNMLWLAGMLTSAELEPDPMAEFEPCGECTLCLDICPVSALDGVTIKQSVCRSFAFGSRDGGEWRIHCFECRRACPNSLGLR